MMNKPAKFLFIFAHPDDEAFYAGGLLAELKKTKAQTKLIILTKSQNPARIKELHQSAQVLGAQYSIGPFTDGEICQNIPEATDYITMAIKEFKPSHIVTFGDEPFYNHFDHLATEKATTNSWRQYNNIYLWKRAYTPSHSQQLKKLRQSRPVTIKNRDLGHLSLPTYQAPNLTISVSKNSRQLQLKALNKHQSQSPESLIQCIKSAPPIEHYFVQPPNQYL